MNDTSPTRVSRLARENGSGALLLRAARSALRRWRDRLTGRRLGAPGFRAGFRPRLLGLSHMRLGRNFHAGDALWLEAVTHYDGQNFNPVLTIGDGATLSDNVHIACLDRIEIGSGLLAGSHVLISDHTHGSYRGELQSDPSTPPAARPLSSAGVVWIGKNVWLGDGVAVLAGAQIGDGAIIGANAVVTGDIPPATIAAGSPARPLRRWDPESRQWLSIPAGTGAACLPAPPAW